MKIMLDLLDGDHDNFIIPLTTGLHVQHGVSYISVLSLLLQYSVNVPQFVLYFIVITAVKWTIFEDRSMQQRDKLTTGTSRLNILVEDEILFSQSIGDSPSHHP